MKKIYPSFISVLLTVFILLIIRVKIVRPMLLADLFIYGSGIIEAVLLAIYAGFITWKMLELSESSKWRIRIWTFFSVVFFTQFLLGIFVSDVFLMSGKLHVPVPMVIMAGPVFRGDGFFMPILLLSTIVLTGPAWCSYLCYIGSWDAIASNSKKRPVGNVGNRFVIRSGITIVLISAALILRITKTAPVYAAYLAVSFGLIGVLIMIVYSSRKGIMVNCIAWCPIGIFTTVLGRISPFRISFNDNCSSCGVCTSSCRYDSLRPSDISNKKPGLTCTLCGDCIASCHGKSLQYSFGQFRGDKVRIFFIVLIVVTHSVFLGLARI